MSQLSISLLGYPRVERDGRAVEVDTRKATALLAYLSVTGRSHGRDALAGLLWPDYSQDRARAALRRTLSTLNRALDGRWLRADRASVGLEPDGVALDVDRFRALASDEAGTLADLREAADLYRGDFLAGFSLRDSGEFDDWQFFQAESLRAALASVLERLVRAEGDADEPAAAIGHARRWLALDPLHEPAHRELMRLYADNGQHAAALRQYRECVRVLNRELGVPPLEETTALHQQIQERRPRPTDEPARSAAMRDGPAAPPARERPPTPTAAVATPAAAPAGGPPATAPAGGPPATAPAGGPPAPAGSAARRLAPPRPLGSVRPPGTSRPPTADRPLVAPRPPAEAAPATPLVGRGEEQATLRRAWQAVTADAPGGHLAVVEGEAGIGKTRLTGDAFAGFRDALVAARCYEGEEQLAYGLVGAALRATLAHPPASGWWERVEPRALTESIRLVPEVRDLRPDLPEPSPLDTPGANSRFLDGVCETLAAACTGAGDAPGILVLDDVHWADGASLDVLTYLVRRLETRPLLVVLCWRPEEVGRDHRLRRLLADALRGGRATHLVLRRLDRDAVATLVAAAGFGADTLAGRLHEETEGLPFFVAQYLQALSGAPGEGGRWRVPGGVRDLLRARIAAVGDTASQLLGAAAAIGRAFDLETVKAASGRSDEEVVAGLEELLERGLVAETAVGTDGTPAYDFTHSKIRDVTYGETSLARRRLLHRRVAEALVAGERGRRGPEGTAATIARHFRLAGDDEAAAHHFRRAGDHARSLYANAEAIEHYRTALALGHRDEAALHEAIGDVETRTGAYADALTSYETAAALRDPGDSAALAATERRLGLVHLRLGDWELAERRLGAALAGLGADAPPAARAQLLAEAGLAAHRRGDAPAAAARAREALDLAEAAGDNAVLAQAHNVCGILATADREVDAARSHLRRSLELATRDDDREARVAALNNLALAAAAAGDLREAIALAEEALALCASTGDRHREAAIHNTLGDLLRASGDVEGARRRVATAVALFAEIGEGLGDLQPEIWKLREW